MYKSILVFVFAILQINTLSAQKVASPVQKKIEWLNANDTKKPLLKHFNLRRYNINGQERLGIQFSLRTTTKALFTISNTEYEPLEGFSSFIGENLTAIPSQIEYRTYHTMEGIAGYSGLVIAPLKQEGGRIYKLVSFDYTLTDGDPFFTPQNNLKRAASTSVLSTGKWVKFSVTRDGMYKIDAAWLSAAGFDVNSIDPRTIKIYGHHGGMLPEANAVQRPSDIPENAIEVMGENDGRFDQGDYILFYAQGPDKWAYDNEINRYKHIENFYSDKSYFFITYGGSTGKRVGNNSDGNSLSADKSFDYFNYRMVHEEDKENICKEGRITLGERFDITTSYNFTENIPDWYPGKQATIYFFGVSTSVAGSALALSVNNSSATTMIFPGLIETEDPPCFKSNGVSAYAFTPTGSQISLNFTYNKPLSSSKAWLDYYEIQGFRKLSYNEGFMPFRNYESSGATIAEYKISSLPASARIYDVSDPLNVKIQSTFSDNGQWVFRTNTGGKVAEYVMNDGNTLSPELEGSVENQNLHATGIVQYIIVSPPEFMDAANKLADFHRTRDNLDIAIVTPQQIYNEFSSGSQDISGIRDYFTHVYYNNTNPANQLRYALFLGDASYDYKNKVKNNNNFIPTFESDHTLNNHFFFVENYCSDDFFGFLDPGDGLWEDEQRLEIVIGRLPVGSASEAMDVVNKIIRYKETPALGDWRSKVTFLADDVDENWEGVFVSQMESVFSVLDTKYKNINVSKIYLDAYTQENLGGSQRYPDAQTDVKNSFEDGTLIFTYIGHGGEEYLASEKVLDIPLVKAMKNINTMPAVFTGSCTISKYDDATHKSGGEYLLTNPEGGAIALISTTRIVYVDQNYQLTYQFFDSCAYIKVGGKWPTLGQVYKKMKNRDNQDPNDRKFVLLGDPALTLNYPEHSVVLDSMNGKSLSSGSDTLKALSKVTFKGHIEDISGNPMNNFNGLLFPTIFDKKAVFSTLGNNVYNIKNQFQLYNNILYKGESSVSNGLFSFSFVVPKDIAYNYGYGKISLYAQDATVNTDGWGNNGKITIGGTAPNVPADNNGPLIELAVDDYSFISGGLTDQTPLLMARISDENGINTTGSGIGRDLMITIDKGTAKEKTYIVNSYYKSKLNSYSEGELKYQLGTIEEGKHTYTLKAWDVFNNSSEATIEFVVASSEEFSIRNVLNYPNPFSTHTTFHFDHNRSGQNLTVTITIMSITGKVIKTVEQYIPSAGGHVSEIAWNGRDDFDDKPSKGVYIYRINVRTDDGQSDEKIEKLVILN